MKIYHQPELMVLFSLMVFIAFLLLAGEIEAGHDHREVVVAKDPGTDFTAFLWSGSPPRKNTMAPDLESVSNSNNSSESFIFRNKGSADMDLSRLYLSIAGSHPIEPRNLMEDPATSRFGGLSSLEGRAPGGGSILHPGENFTVTDENADPAGTEDNIPRDGFIAFYDLDTNVRAGSLMGWGAFEELNPSYSWTNGDGGYFFAQDPLGEPLQYSFEIPIGETIDLSFKGRVLNASSMEATWLRFMNQDNSHRVVLGLLRDVNNSYSRTNLTVTQKTDRTERMEARATSLDEWQSYRLFLDTDWCRLYLDGKELVNTSSRFSESALDGPVSFQISSNIGIRELTISSNYSFRGNYRINIPSSSVVLRMAERALEIMEENGSMPAGHDAYGLELEYITEAYNIRVLARAYELTGDARYKEAVERSASYLLDHAEEGPDGYRWNRQGGLIQEAAGPVLGLAESLVLVNASDAGLLDRMDTIVSSYSYDHARNLYPWKTTEGYNHQIRLVVGLAIWGEFRHDSTPVQVLEDYVKEALGRGLRDHGYAAREAAGTRGQAGFWPRNPTGMFVIPREISYSGRVLTDLGVLRDICPDLALFEDPDFRDMVEAAVHFSELNYPFFNYGSHYIAENDVHFGEQAHRGWGAAFTPYWPGYQLDRRVPDAVFQGKIDSFWNMDHTGQGGSYHHGYFMKDESLNGFASQNIADMPGIKYADMYTDNLSGEFFIIGEFCIFGMSGRPGGRGDEHPEEGLVPIFRASMDQGYTMIELGPINETELSFSDRTGNITGVGGTYAVRLSTDYHHATIFRDGALIDLVELDRNGVASFQVDSAGHEYRVTAAHRRATAVIVSISPNPALETHTIRFSGDSTGDTTIMRYVWHSSIDGELYNGTWSEFELPGLSPGEHIISLHVLDLYDAWSEGTTATLIVEEENREDPDVSSGSLVLGITCILLAALVLTVKYWYPGPGNEREK